MFIIREIERKKKLFVPTKKRKIKIVLGIIRFIYVLLVFKFCVDDILPLLLTQYLLCYVLYLYITKKILILHLLGIFNWHMLIADTLLTILINTLIMHPHRIYDKNPPYPHHHQNNFCVEFGTSCENLIEFAGWSL
jgi:hypothetical protein